MNYYALVIGSILALLVIIRFKKRKLEKVKWVYPAFLATFPIYYWIFAIYAQDYTSLKTELLIGSVFLIIAFIAYKLNSFLGLILLALGYISHAIYDVIHTSLFENRGTPIWWAEFCGSVDIIIGVYIVLLAIKVKKSKVYNKTSKRNSLP